MNFLFSYPNASRRVFESKKWCRESEQETMRTTRPLVAGRAALAVPRLRSNLLATERDAPRPFLTCFHCRTRHVCQLCPLRVRNPCLTRFAAVCRSRQWRPEHVVFSPSSLCRGSEGPLTSPQTTRTQGPASLEALCSANQHIIWSPAHSEKSVAVSVARIASHAKPDTFLGSLSLIENKGKRAVCENRSHSRSDLR